ncbi:CD63 antigen [Halotydeus destructor]|nr:CD63 antigen [Halotydeus destructor]
MVDGGLSCVKYILFVFNFIFVIFGGLLCWFGYSMMENSKDFGQLFDTPDTVAIGVIIVGFFVFLIAFLGCCGAIMESYCILLTFGIVVAVMLTVELILAGLVFAFKTDVQNAAEHGLSNGLNKYNASNPDAHYTRIIDDLQSSFKCCGINNASDWWGLVDPFQPNLLPKSCCDKTNPEAVCMLKPDGPMTSTTTERAPIAGSGFNPLVSESAAIVVDQGPFDHGCLPVIVDSFSNSLGPVGGACLAVALFQLIGIVFAFCLGRAVKREYQVV